MEDIARTILFVVDDREWLRKVVVGAAFTCLLIVGVPFILGYMLELQRRMVRGVEPTLPEWDDLPNKFMDGLKLFGVALESEVEPVKHDRVDVIEGLLEVEVR